MQSSVREGPSPLALVKRRAGWIVLAAAACAAAIAAIVTLTEPRYRVVSSLELAGRSLPAESGTGSRASGAASVADARRIAETHIGERHERSVRAAGADASAARVTITDVQVGPASQERAAPEPARFTAVFEVVVDAADAAMAEREARELIDAYLEDDARTASAPAVAPAERDAVRREIEAAAAAKRAVEAELSEFGWSAGGSTDLRTVSGRVVVEAEREHAQVAAQLGALEGRRNDLDRGLADVERAAARLRPAAGEPIASDALAALEARHAVLRGLWGSENREAAEFGALMEAAAAESARRYDTVSADLAATRSDFQSLQGRLPLDHPDVVGLAYRLSALEAEADAVRVTRLTAGERAYYESLGRERREIDAEINAARAAVAEAEARIGEARASADQVPALEGRYASLLGRLDAADRSEAEARQRLEAFESREADARRHRPGTLSVTAAAAVAPIPWRRSDLIVAAGAVLGLIAVFLVVALVERSDRRIDGAAGIAWLAGEPPLIEIPALSGR